MIACLFSGGKDSTLALHRAYGLGIKAELLITFKSRNPDSYMFHYPNIEHTKLQANALGIKQVFVETMGEKEKELDDLENALKENDVTTIITGATYSRYQSERINKIAERLGIEHIAPLWHIDPLEELNEIAERYNAIITKVSAEGLDKSLLGKRIDKDIIKALEEASKKYGINMLFEGGEGESFVLDAPLFKKKIVVKSFEIIDEGMSATYKINKAILEEK
jgi:ABC transporter with metal-binding/Fe-S-binding domain ATP-binding protein